MFDGGIYITVDGGDSWKRVPAGPDDNGNNFHMIVVAGSDPIAFITFGLNTRQAEAFGPSLNVGFLQSVYREESRKTFRTNEVVESNLTHLAVSSHGMVLYATVTDAYHHLISTDGGTTLFRQKHLWYSNRIQNILT